MKDIISKLTRATAVVVNDDETELNILSALVRKAGLDPVVFRSVEAALAAMDASAPPTIIVTDLTMPGIDGWRFCRLLRSPEYSAFNPVPILVVSATYSGEQPERIAADLGAEAFFPSPVDGRRFVELVRAILNGEKKRIPLRVLIVDADKTFCALLKEAFSADGHQVDVALTAGEAIDAFTRSPYHVAVLDYHLPDASGDTLLDRFQAERPDCVCLMMSTDLEAEPALGWLKRGAAAYLRKPFAPAYLMELCARTRRERALLRAQDLLEARTRQLRESEERYRKITETITDYVYTVHLEQGKVVATKHGPGCHAVTGYKDEEFDKDPFLWLSMILPEDRHQLVQWARLAAAGEEVAPIEHRIVRKDGKTRWVRNTPVFHRDRHGALLSYDGLIQDITESKQALDALKRKSTEQRMLLDTIGIQVWYLTEAHTYGRVNRAHADFLGLRVQDIAHKRIEEFLPAELAEMLRRGNVEVFETGRAIHTEEWLPNARGEQRLIQVSKIPRLDEQGNVAFVVCTGTDITELRASEKRFRNIYEMAPIGIELYDASGRLVMANQTCLNIFGVVNSSDISGFDLFTDPNVSKEDVHKLRGGETVRYEVEFDFEKVHKAGFYRTRKSGSLALDVLIAPMKSELDASPSGYLALVQDVSARRQAENTLRESEAKYRRLAESSPAVIYQLRMSPEGTFNFAFLGGAVKAQIGFPAEAVLQNASLILDRMHPDDCASFHQSAMKSAETLQPWHGIARFRVEESERWFEWHSTPDRQADGSVLWDGLFLDVTDRVLMERRIRQIEKTDSLSRMAGAVAHHFNNKLGAVIGNLEMAMADISAGSMVHGVVSEAEQAARQAADTSRLLVTFLGQSQSKPELLDLSKACSKCLGKLREKVPERVSFATDLPAPGPVIRADPALMDMVISALVNNALEALGDLTGQVRISIDTANSFEVLRGHRFPPEWEASGDDYACLTVADTGCGMDEKTIGRIFDPFYTDKFLGRGLGLPVALGIVKSFGGCISVESGPNQGSLFRVFLPLAPAAAARPPERKSFADGTFLANGMVLVVEDQEMLRNMVKTMLVRLGFDVLVAGDGAAAVAIFRERRDDIRLVLCDLTMPRMNGWETLAAVRQMRPGVPVILASGFDEARVMAEEHADLPLVFLAKPYTRESLLEAIRKALGEEDST